MFWAILCLSQDCDYDQEEALLYCTSKALCSKVFSNNQTLIFIDSGLMNTKDSGIVHKLMWVPCLDRSLYLEQQSFFQKIDLKVGKDFLWSMLTF